MDKLQLTALELLFKSDISDTIDVFIDYITEEYNTDPEYLEYTVTDDGGVAFIFEGPDWDSAEYDEEEDEYVDGGEVETMVLGVFFKPGSDSPELKWIKNR